MRLPSLKKPIKKLGKFFEDDEKNFEISSFRSIRSEEISEFQKLFNKLHAIRKYYVGEERLKDAARIDKIIDTQIKKINALNKDIKLIIRKAEKDGF